MQEQVVTINSPTFHLHTQVAKLLIISSRPGIIIVLK